MKLSIIIPAYNEAKTITKTIIETADYLNSQALKDIDEFELIVVDDGSTDQTAELVEKLNVSGLKLIKHQQNRGKGAAVKSGIYHSTGDYFLFFDADNSTKISEIGPFLEQLEAGYDLVIASRAGKDSRILNRQPYWKEFFGRQGNKVIRLITGLPFRDTQCGFKVFSRNCLGIFEKLTLEGWAFDVELLIIARLNNFRTADLPVTWSNNADSRMRLRNYPEFLIDILKIFFNKLKRKYHI
jgi:glycosyltransferase involved in cell wall biosynthesis